MSILRVLEDAVDGCFPSDDGSVEVLPAPDPMAGAVVAFSAHFYVLAPVEPAWVRAQLPPGDYTAPLGPRFVLALADRLGADAGSHDVLLGSRAVGGGSELDLVEMSNQDRHPRIQRARCHRTHVRAWRTRDGAGVVVLGRGLAGRWEVATEVAPEARGRGLGRSLIRAALCLLDPGTALFGQVAPGNSASLRAAIAAGFQPLGAEVLFTPRMTPESAAAATRVGQGPRAPPWDPPHCYLRGQPMADRSILIWQWAAAAP